MEKENCSGRSNQLIHRQRIMSAWSPLAVCLDRIKPTLSSGVVRRVSLEILRTPELFISSHEFNQPSQTTFLLERRGARHEMVWISADVRAFESRVRETISSVPKRPGRGGGIIKSLRLFVSELDSASPFISDPFLVLPDLQTLTANTKMR